MQDADPSTGSALVWPLLAPALSTMLSASLMQQQQHFWARQGQHNPHRRFCSDQQVLHTASVACCQHLNVPQLFSISLGCEKSRGCSVPVSHAMFQGMLGCMGVWRGGGQMTATTARMPHAALPGLETPKLSFLLQLGLVEETRARRELLGMAMGMPAHLPGCK